MSNSSSHNSTTSTPNTTIHDALEGIPCVQYGFPEDTGPLRAPKLRTIFEPVPDDAETASPVYVLSRDEYERQDDFESGYEVKGYTSIATELQHECEADDRVLYPVYIESDKYRDKGPAILLEWFRDFVENYLGVSFHTCTLYYSGNRSIHVHVPRFVAGEDQRERLKELAETFCAETGAELDCGLYYSKRMFRLPGVEHAETGLRKVEIEPEWDHDRIIRESSTATSGVPESFESVLRHVFATQPSLTVESPETTLEPPYDLFRVLDSEKTILELARTESDEHTIDTPLIEQEECPDEDAAVPEWAQYNAKEFSPYALADENDRSVAVVEVKGGAFARKDIRDGTTLIPAYFHGARGCAGEEFTKDEEHAPLQLSKRDYEKWNFEEGDHVVVIGGQSRSSRIFEVEPWQATVAGHALTGDDASREAALSYLREEGYDTGGTDSTTQSSSRYTHSSTDADRIWPARENPRTEAERLQQKAEQEGIGTLTHKERIRVACRHLQYGWEPAWKWFQEQFGPDFKPEVTWRQFRSIVEGLEGYDHVEVPSRPP